MDAMITVNALLQSNQDTIADCDRAKYLRSHSNADPSSYFLPTSKGSQQSIEL